MDSSSSNNHKQRLAECWKIQDCGRCINSEHGCGWCPSSTTCIPATSLLSPLNQEICPLSSERYELRTKTLGCNCSTITLLSIIVTIFCTIATILLLWMLVKATKWVYVVFGPGTGWEIRFLEGGSREEGVWVRKVRWWGRQDRVLDERRALL